MGTTNAMETSSVTQKRSGILYPLMLIAAIALIAFSAVGIATMMGWMPAALSGGDRAMTPERSEPAAKAGAVRPRPMTGAPAASAGAVRPRASASAACSDCGMVESIRVVEVEGDGSGVGAIGGAVVGGILGNQVGRGRGRTAATVVGAGAGAYAGHEIEKNVKKTTRYQVRVRMNDGTYRTFHESTQPALAVGQKVRVTEQGVVAAG